MTNHRMRMKALALIMNHGMVTSWSWWMDRIMLERYQHTTMMFSSYSISYLAANYYWPKNLPPPIRGNPPVNGIVAGQFYDTNTPYIMTSEMREHVPFTSLLISQSISWYWEMKHIGIHGRRYPCWRSMPWDWCDWLDWWNSLCWKVPLLWWWNSSLKT